MSAGAHHALRAVGSSRAHEACDDYLPERMPAALKRERTVQTVFGGLAVAGDPSRHGVADMKNISPMGAPALTVRPPRGLYMGNRNSQAPHGMVAMGGRLYFVQGTELFRADGAMVAISVGTVSDTDKQFAVFGDTLFILPDKLYYTEANGVCLPVELQTEALEACEFSGDTIILPKGMTWGSLGFMAGDCIHVVNADDVTPAPEGDYAIRHLSGRTAYLTRSFSASYISTAVFERRMPDMDGICVSGDRIYGCRGKEVFVSAAGKPFNWYAGEADGDSDPAVLRADTEGDFVACAPWQGSAVFFKQDHICKLLGSRAESFVLNDLAVPGVPAALANTVCEVGGALYYHAGSGVYRYEGGLPVRVDTPSGLVGSVTGGCGGTDGLCYYVTVKDDAGERRQYVYSPAAGAWYAEDGNCPVFMGRWHGFLALQDENGVIWLATSDGRTLPCSFDEKKLSVFPKASVTFLPDRPFLPDGFRLLNLYIRATADEGAMMRVMIAYAEDAGGIDADPDRAEEIARINGGMNDRLIRIPLLPRRCDAAVIKLEMTGQWTISAVVREYEQGRQ